MKSVLSWITAGLAGAALWLAATGFTPYEANRYFHDAEKTVHQLVHDSGAKGSAVIFSDGRLLTAAHMFDDGFDGWNVVVDGVSVPVGTLEFIDFDSDIAVFTAAVRCPCAPLGHRDLEQYQEVFAAGHPEGIPVVVITEGRYQGEDTIYHTLNTAHIARGSSGGALFAIEDGRFVLVGITVYVRGQMVTTPFGRGGAPVNYLVGAVKLEYVKQAILCADGSDSAWCIETP